jgi:mitotic spindle assembly checkpoint protein MAD2
VANHIRRVKKYGLNMLVSTDDQVKAYIKRIMGQLKKWMEGSKISKLVIVITDKETGDNIERWQFDVRQYYNYRLNKLLTHKRSKYLARAPNQNPAMAQVIRRILRPSKFIV